MSRRRGPWSDAFDEAFENAEQFFTELVGSDIPRASAMWLRAESSPSTSRAEDLLGGDELRGAPEAHDASESVVDPIELAEHVEAEPSRTDDAIESLPPEAVAALGLDFPCCGPGFEELGAEDVAALGLDFPEAPAPIELLHPEQASPPAEDDEAAPRAINCFELTTHRAMDLTADGAVTLDAPATASTPPRFGLGTPTRFRTVAGLEASFPREATPTANPDELLLTTRGRVLLDTGHLRVDPGNATRFQVRLRALVCHPARGSGTNELPRGEERFPVVVIVHGNHAAIEVDLADSGGTRSTGTRMTSTGPQPVTLIPARATLRHEVPSYRGYRYLQEHLAEQGIVSVSIDTNAANELGSLIRFRADLVTETLDHLRSLHEDPASPFFERLDLDKVALVGHSRGGDAVAMAAELNRRRTPSARFGLRAVVAIAPTDFTGMLAASSRLRMRSQRTASFLCVYGSHDGDVSGAHDPDERGQGWGFVGTGFRHYDRASTQRAMVFVHGATHNRFNSVWIDPAAHEAGSPAHQLALAQADNGSDADTVDPALPPSTAFPVPAGHRDARVLTAADHQTLAREYIGGWLTMWLRNDVAQQRRFVGQLDNGLRVPVGLQWKLGRTVRGIDDFDDAAPGSNVMGGAVTRPGFIRERLIELSDLAHVPHAERVLEAGAPSGSSRTYRTEIPSGKGDWSSLTALTFRIAKQLPDLATPTAIAGASFPPRVTITLWDGRARATVDHAAIAALNPRTVRPYHRQLGALDLTKVHLQTWQIPLRRFTGISLSSVRAVEITFDASAGEAIHLDTLSVVRL